LISLTVFALRYFNFFNGFPRSALLIAYVLLFLFMGGIRLSKRIYLGIKSKAIGSRKDRTLIVGAGDAGEQIARNILSHKDQQYNLVGFVDDTNIKQGVKIHGLKVLGV